MNLKFYAIALAALFGLMIGSFIGGLLDQAGGASIDPNRQGAFDACKICPDALFPYMGEVVKVNLGTIFGAVAGLGVGVMFGWALAGSSSGSQSQGGPGATFTRSGGSTADDTLVASRSTLTTQSIQARAAPVDETLARQVEQLTALTRADASLHESFDAQKILMRSHDEAMRLSQADFASVILLDWNAPMRGKAMRVGTAIDYERFSPSEESVLATNQSHLIGNYENEPETPLIAGVRSSLLVPIAYDEKVIGLIGLHSEKPAAFNVEIQEVIEVLAAQTAVALGNARRYEEQIQRGEVLRGRADQLQSLFKIATSIQPEHSLAANLETIAFGIQQSAGFNVAVVSVIAPNTHQLEWVAAAGLPVATFDQLKQTTQSWDMYRAYLRADYQIGAAYFIPREQADELYRLLDRIEAAKPAETQSAESWRRGDVLLLPIYSAASEPLGLIQLDDPRSGKAPTQAVVDVLELFTGPAMLVIENAHLLDAARERINESRERAQQLEALGEASNVIARTLRREEVVAVSLEQLRRVVPYDRATLYLRDVADGRFRVTGTRNRDGGGDWIGMAPELLDRSLFAEIAANRRMLIVADISGDSRFPKSSQQARGAWLGVPLLSKGDVVGVLGLDKLESGYYTPANTYVATAFANQMSVALENAGLYEANVERAADLSERFHRLALFNSITSKSIDPTDLDQASRVVLQGLMDALKAESGALFLFRDGSTVDGKLTQTPGEVRSASIEQLGVGDVIRRVRDSRRAQVIFTAHDSGGNLLNAPAAQILILPLLVGNAFVGLLALGRKQEADEYTAPDLEAGETVALQAAALLQSTRLLTSTREQLTDAQFRARQLDAVNGVARSLAGSGQRQDVTATALDQLRNVLTFDRAILYWRNPDERRFTAADSRGEAGTSPEQALFDDLLDERRPLVVADTGSDPRFAKTENAEDGAWLGVPLISRGEVVGLLSLDKREPGYYTESHAVVAAAFASYVSAALENVRLLEENVDRTADLNQRIHRLTLLNSIAAEVVGSLDVERVARTALKGLSEALSAQSGAVILLEDGASDTARLLKQSDATSQPVSLEVTGAEQVTRRLRDSAQPITLQGADLAAQADWVGLGMRQALIVPLVANDALIGALALGRDTEVEFTSEDLEVAKGAASQAAVMVSNARHYQKAQQRLVELSNVSQASRALIAELDFKRLSEVIRTQVAGLSAAQNFVVALYDETRNELSFPVAVEAGATVDKPPMAPGGVSQYLIQSRDLLRLGTDSDARLRAAGLPDLTSRAGAWDAVSGESYLGLPLVVGNRVVGLVELADARPDAFTETHERVLNAVAPQIAAAIEHSRQHEQLKQAASAVRGRLAELQERAAQLEALNESSLSLSSTLRSTEVYSLVADQLQKVLPYDRLTLWVRDETGQMTTAVARGDGTAALDTPLYTQVASTRSSVVVEDVTADIRNHARTKGAWLGLPLLNRGELVGLIGLDKDETGFYTDRHAALADAFGAQVANAIENARLFENSLHTVQALNERTRHFATINRISSALSGTLDVATLAQTGARELAAALESDAAGVVLFDEEGGSAAHYPVNEEAALPTSKDGLVERLRASLTPMALETVDESAAKWMGEGIKSALALPLVVDGTLRGVAYVGDKKAARQYSDDTLELGSTIAQHIAAAVQNAWLYQRTQKRLVELGSLSQIGRAVSGAIEKQKLYAAVREQVQGLLAPESLCVALYDEAHSQVSFPLFERDGKAVDLKPQAPAGLIWHILRTQQSVLLTGGADDKRKGQIASVAADKANVLRGKSFLGAPLVVDDRAIGVLAVASSQPNAFEAEHERLLTNVASQVAAAIENGRIFEASVQRANELSARVQSLALVNRVSAQLTGVLDSNRVLTVAAHELATALSADHASVISLNGETRLAAYPNDAVTTLPSLDGGWLVEQLRARLQPIALEETSEALVTPAYTAWLGEGLKGALVLPLVAGDSLVGVASIGTVAPRELTPEETAIATQIASHIAGALHHARQYEAASQRGDSLSERAQRLGLLTRASSEMNRSLESERVMEIGLKELAAATQSEIVYGATLDDGQKKAARQTAGAVAEAAAPAEGDSVIEQLRETLSPVVISEPSKRTPWIGEAVQTAIALPLAAHGKLVGVAAIASNAIREWTAGEIELATALTSEMAVALHNARLHERTLKRLVELGAIAQSTRAVSGSVELSKLYETVRTQVGSLVGAKTMSLALYDETRNEVSFPVMVKDGRSVEAKPGAPNPVLWRIIQTQQSLRWSRSDDAPMQELGIAHAGNGKGNGSNGANGSNGYGKSYVGVPLVAGKKTIGVLSVADDEHNDAFDAEHERVLQTLASQVASALDSARLYESAQRKVQTLEGRLQMLSAVNRAALEMSRTLEPKQVLEIGLDELSHLPAVDGTVAVLYEDGQPMLFGDGKPVEAAVGPGEHDALVEYIRQSRAPLAIADLDNDSLAKPISRAWLGTKTTSALVLPLMADGAWLGLAAVSAHAPRTFSPDDTDWAAAVAGQMASALHHARQYETAERRLTEAVTVNGALRAIQRANDLPQLWDALRSQVMSLAGVNTMALQLYDETTGEVAVPLLVQKGEAVEAEPQIPGAITRHVIVTQRPLLLNGSLRESAAAAGITLHDGNDGELITGRSLLAVPLMSGEHVAGVLTLAADTADALNSKHITIFTALAGPFAAALENARTLARTRGELAREQSLIEQSRVSAQSAADEVSRLRAEQAALLEQSHKAAQDAATEATQLRAEQARLREQQTTFEKELEQAQAELARLRERETGHLRRETQLDFLLHFTDELTADDPSTMLKRALLTAGESVNAEFGALYLRTPNGTQLKQAAAFGPQRALDGATTAFDTDEGLVGWVYSNRAALRLTGLAEDGRWRSRPVLNDKQYQVALAAPLLAMGHVEGVLTFLNPADRAFSTSHEQLITAAARQLALAVRRGEEPHAAIVVPVLARSDEAVASTASVASVVPIVVPETTPQATTEVVTMPEHAYADEETVSAEPESVFAAEHTAAPALDEQPADVDEADDTVIVPVPTASESSTDATLIVPRRAPLAADTALEEISPSQLQPVDDVEYSEPQSSINPILLVGLVVALIVGAFLITFLVTSGGLASLFGGTQQPTQIVVVTNAPTSTTANEVVATTAPTLEPTSTVAPSVTPTETVVPTETPTETAIPTEAPTAGPTLPPGVVALGTIQVTQGTSARLRATPNGTVVGSVPDDTSVQVLQGQEFVDGISWIQIRLPSGEVGWIAESLVEITTSP